MKACSPVSEFGPINDLPGRYDVADARAAMLPIDYFFLWLGQSLITQQSLREVPSDACCDSCCRPASAWPFGPYAYLGDGYSKSSVYCMSCSSLITGRGDRNGWFNKAGTRSWDLTNMDKATLVVSASGHQLFASANVVGKLDLVQRPVLVNYKAATFKERIRWISENCGDEPYLVMTFSVRKDIALNLKVSEGDELYWTDAVDMKRFHLPSVKRFFELKLDQPDLPWTEIEAQLKRFYRGRIAPGDLEFGRWLRELSCESLTAWMQGLPSDPWLRLDTILLVSE
ncbi:hypothetical protein SAMN02745129_2325 [Ferrimonas marina]|uniref:Uncharacterized protein n=2 Tax=Ferrimonas marina TaxID=299255 RepID=A0A1M5TYD0_9GAMM|nr:hypothetical protein SAMN02745129_2325 [Ferrimonas marina]